MPVRYLPSLEDCIGISELQISFLKLDKKRKLEFSYERRERASGQLRIDVSEAKRRLAAFYNVAESEISISISIKS